MGALCWQTTQLEPYSSVGPTIDGRTKPDLVAPDSIGERTSLPLKTTDGHLVGALAWTPERPGNALIRLITAPRRRLSNAEQPISPV